jgi:hypothetical protein
VARRILSPADAQLRDQYKLKGWVLKPKQRKREYFGWCDSVLERLGTWSGDDGPADRAVILSIVSALMSDDTFSAHLEDKGGDFLMNDENWDRLYRVGGGTIYHEYLVALEKHDWPEEA